MTDGHHKYVWYSQTGREHLFDLDGDPMELRDLALQPNTDMQLDPWRRRLIELLKGRPEGASDGDQLLVGKPHNAYLPGYDPSATYPFL